MSNETRTRRVHAVFCNVRELDQSSSSTNMQFENSLPMRSRLSSPAASGKAALMCLTAVITVLTVQCDFSLFSVLATCEH